MSKPQSLYDKLWNTHLVVSEGKNQPAILYIDQHLIHEVTSPQGFDMLRQSGLGVRRPDLCLATIDHSTPTRAPQRGMERPYANPRARAQVEQLQQNCEQFGIEFHGWNSARRGIVHVIGPELGVTQPGRTIVCGDSHTSTHGAFGALAFGIGTTEVGHVLASQCLLQRKSKSMRIRIDGRLGAGVSAKDLVLHTIGKIGMAGGTGHVIEFSGQAIRDLDMEGRMTVCNMSIEAGARSGLVAADEKTIKYLKGRKRSPQGAEFEPAAQRWASMISDSEAEFDREVSIDARLVEPTITYGTHPGMSIPIGASVPPPRDDNERRALRYMELEPGQPLAGKTIDVVFLGSCTNGRLGDLRVAADILRGRQVAPHITMLVVPGSETVRRQAEQEGLHHVFQAAGAEWRLPGCSMCLAMNGDAVPPGKFAVSTSNRNFEGRQGPDAKTFLASPATAAASAVAGVLTGPERYTKQAEVA